eukprot:c20755_g1_i1 orf=294-986(-)
MADCLCTGGLGRACSAAASLPLSSLERVSTSSPYSASLLAPLALHFIGGSSSPPQKLALVVRYRRRCALGRPGRLGLEVLTRCAQAFVQEEEVPVVITVKDFLEELKQVGRVRIVVNTGVGVLESVTSLEKLFYHTLPGRGEYANVMNQEENIDFHLLIDKVKAAELSKGKTMRGDIPTYTICFFDDDDKAAAKFLVMWKQGTNGEYDPGQVEAFEQLLEKYGKRVKFQQ